LSHRDINHRYVAFLDITLPLDVAPNAFCYDKGNPGFHTFFANMYVRALNNTGMEGLYFDNWAIWGPSYREVDFFLNNGILTLDGDHNSGNTITVVENVHSDIPNKGRIKVKNTSGYYTSMSYSSRSANVFNVGTITTSHADGAEVWVMGPKLHPLNPRTGLTYTWTEYRNDCLAQVQAVVEAVNSRYPTRRHASERPIVIPFNVGRSIGSTEWTIAEMLADPAIPNTTGFWGEGNYFVNSTNPMHSVSTWVKHLQDISNAMEKDYIFIFPVYEWTGGTWPSQSRLMMAYASALLAGGAKFNKLSMNYLYQHQWPGYDIDIGYAQADYYKWPGKNNIYARNFDKALVLVNPSDTAETVEPGITYRRFQDHSVNKMLDWRGLSAETSNPITVAAYSGEVLVTNDYSPLSDCTTLGGSCCPVAGSCGGKLIYSSDCGKHCCVGGSCGDFDPPSTASMSGPRSKLVE